MTPIVVGMIRLYRRFVSAYLPPACRYLPTCSQYAEEAVLEHGIPWGLALALHRILRCHPLCTGGYDPVPPGNPG